MQESEMKERLISGTVGGFLGGSLLYYNATSFSNVIVSVIVAVVAIMLFMRWRIAFPIRNRMHARLKSQGIYSYPMPTWAYVIYTIALIALLALPTIVWMNKQNTNDYLLILAAGWGVWTILVFTMSIMALKEIGMIFKSPPES